MLDIVYVYYFILYRYVSNYLIETTFRIENRCFSLFCRYQCVFISLKDVGKNVSQMPLVICITATKKFTIYFYKGFGTFILCKISAKSSKIMLCKLVIHAMHVHSWCLKNPEVKGILGVIFEFHTYFYGWCFILMKVSDLAFKSN